MPVGHQLLYDSGMETSEGSVQSLEVLIGDFAGAG
jgi:hypothetical protein